MRALWRKWRRWCSVRRMRRHYRRYAKTRSIYAKAVSRYLT